MKRSEKNIRRREEIVDKVISLLSRLNFREATVRNICSEADISVGTFYHYFTEKSDLMAEVLGRIDCYLNEQVKPRLTRADEMENLAEFMKGFAHYTDSVGSVSGGVISSGDIPLPDTPDEIRKEHARPLYAIPREILARAREKGQVPADLDPDETADLLIISLRGHALEWSRRNRCYDIAEKIESFIRLFSNLVKA